MTLEELMRLRAEAVDYAGLDCCDHPDSSKFYNAAHAALAPDGCLTKELERLREMTSCTVGVGDGSGRLFVHGDYDSVKAAQAIILENGRLRAALQQIAHGNRPRPREFADHVLSGGAVR